MKKSTEPDVDFATRVLSAKKRRIGGKLYYEYWHLNFILLGSNTCERPFSVLGHALGDRCLSIAPVNFEYQLLLHVNSRFRGLRKVGAIVRQTKSF